MFLILRVAAAVGFIFYLSPLRESEPRLDLASSLPGLPEPVRGRIVREAIAAMLVGEVGAVPHGHQGAGR